MRVLSLSKLSCRTQKSCRAALQWVHMGIGTPVITKHSTVCSKTSNNTRQCFRRLWGCLISWWISNSVRYIKTTFPTYSQITILWCQMCILWLFFQLFKWAAAICWHYCEVIMGAMAYQITSLTIVYSTVYSDADQRKHQSSASPAFVRGIHQGPVNSPHKGLVTRKMFPFDDVIMEFKQSSSSVLGVRSGVPPGSI